MDQVKKILAVMKQQHFWILCGVISIVGLGSWYATAAKLKSETDANRSQIESAYGKGNAVATTENHPNDTMEEKMARRTLALQKDVVAVWDKQYQYQVTSTLVWPDELTDQFRAAVDSLRPIEKTVPFPTPSEQELYQGLREQYRDYIKEELPKLAEIIGAHWSAKAGAGMGGMEGGGEFGGGGGGAFGGMAGGAGMAMAGRAGMGGEQNSVMLEQPPVVMWDSSNQGEILSRVSWQTAPSTLEVLYAQEDLWVYKALMNIIKKTNAGADSAHKAAIKRIQSISIGRAAVGKSGSIGAGAGGGAAGGDGMSGMMGMGAGMDSGGMESMMAAMGGGGGGGAEAGGSKVVSRDPAEGRYVDNQYEPLPADTLRSDAVTTDPEKVYLAVAKRIPVRIRCIMDQRRLHNFLAECANSPLTVEIRQVRINRGVSGGGLGGGGGAFGGGGGGAFGGGGGEAGMAGMAGGMGAFGGGGMSAQAKPLGPSPYEIPFEFYGIIHIYNPVNKDAITVDVSTSAEGEKSAEAEADTAAAETATGAPAG